MSADASHARWAASDTPPPRPLAGDKSLLQSARILLVLGVGLVSLGAGCVLGYQHAAARVHFAGAPQVTATVVTADYETASRTGGQRITVAPLAPAPAPGAATEDVVDDVRDAPDGLVPGRQLTVLVSPARPGHAVFAGQLGWGRLPVSALALVGVGLAGLLQGGVAAVRSLRRRPAPPEQPGGR